MARDEGKDRNAGSPNDANDANDPDHPNDPDDPSRPDDAYPSRRPTSRTAVDAVAAAVGTTQALRSHGDRRPERSGS